MDTLKRSRLSRVGIVVIAAILVEIIAVIQSHNLRKMMGEEMDIRSRVVMGGRVNDIVHTLELTEITMKENLWDVRQSLAHPDSVFPAMSRLIDDNPLVVGGCLAFIPDYYPSKGRLYEPYASKAKDGTILLSQIAGPDHDYTQNEAFIAVLESGTPLWSDPYCYGPDSLDLATYSYPVRDARGRLVAVCGLDIDLSWLGDTLNARQPFPSSFAFLLTKEGVLVATPPEDRIPFEEVKKVLPLLDGEASQFTNSKTGIRKMSMSRQPYWEVVQVYKTKEVFSRITRMRRQQMLFILLGLAILAFMINRYARNERILRKTSEEQARMGGELAVARQIQHEMLPKTFPSFVYGSLEPAREVGGDLFDFFTRDGKLFFCIGDVSGKGVPSALFVSMAQSLFRLVTQKEESPSCILKALNQELCRGNESNMFLTFFMGCLDTYSGELHYATAGHDLPFLLTEEITPLPAKANLPLGIFPETRFEEHACILAPGSVLFLYTDGLTEAKNVDRKQFSFNGITTVLKTFLAGPERSLEKLVSSMSEAAHLFAGSAPQSDDLTMLAVSFYPEGLIREQITLGNEIAEVARFSPFVKAFLGKLNLPDQISSGMRLALEEAVVNVINYAYPAGEKGEVQIRADSNLKEVRFTVIDSGVPFDPTTVLEPDTTLDAHLRPIGGLGIFLSRKLMDSISYSRRDGKNILTLTKSIL